MRRRGFSFDDMDSLISAKDKERQRSKLHMVIAINLKDIGVIKKLREIYTKEQSQLFQEYLKNKVYLKSAPNANNLEIDSMYKKTTSILRTSIPEDPFLNEIYNKFTENLNRIDKLKDDLTQNYSDSDLNLMLYLVENLYEQNEKLYEELDAYEPIIPPRD